MTPISSKRILRVFPRRTRATPDDEMVRVGVGPDLFDEADEVHVSVTFSWDIPTAERLSRAWAPVAPVTVGGPACGTSGEAFEPGQYIRRGYTITSRGCPNRCWFCSVWKREGKAVRELPIRDGWNVLDDNLLACSPAHIAAVFAMLERQDKPPQFTGGLEAQRMTPSLAADLRRIRTRRMYFAYDTPDDLEPLRAAGRMLLSAGFTRTSHVLCAYVLCGFPKDDLRAAQRRMEEAMEAGFTPMAMLYRDETGTRDPTWARWARRWARPAIIHSAKPATQKEVGP